MMRFFAYLRQMFAVDKAYQVLTEVLYDAINSTYIPQLQKQAEMTKSAADREAIYALIEQYKKYANPQTAEGRELAEITERTVGSTANKYRNSGVVFDDVVQQIAGDFYANPRMQQALKDFKVDGGPIKMRNFWSAILNRHSEFQFREAERKIIQRSKIKRDDDGLVIDPLTNVPAPKGFEVSDFNELLDRMVAFFREHVGHAGKFGYEREAAIETFDIWIKELRKENSLDIGPEEVQKQWEDARKKRGEKITRTSFYYGLKIIKDVLKQFFIEEKQYQRAAGKTSAERVAKAEFRVRFAKWMLGE